MRTRSVAVFLIVAACHASDSASTSSARVSADFAVTTIKRVILRAGNPRNARIVKGSAGHVIVSGVPSGGAAGYHPSDRKWRKTPASDWGLGFRAKQFGDTLVVSTFNEIAYIEHAYYLDQLAITTPPDVTVVLEERRLSSDGAADLGPPQ